MNIYKLENIKISLKLHLHSFSNRASATNTILSLGHPYINTGYHIKQLKTILLILVFFYDYTYAYIKLLRFIHIY